MEKKEISENKFVSTNKPINAEQRICLHQHSLPSDIWYN